MMDAEADFETILSSMPDYDAEHGKRIDKVKTRALKNLGKRKKRG